MRGERFRGEEGGTPSPVAISKADMITSRVYVVSAAICDRYDCIYRFDDLLSDIWGKLVDAQDGFRAESTADFAPQAVPFVCMQCARWLVCAPRTGSKGA